MKISESNVIRFHLQVLYGISVKKFKRNKGRWINSGAKVFGVPLDNLARRYIPEYGLVPCFLVDACSLLLDRIGTVGLFRKPGSLTRIKVLRAKLNRGEESLSTALPYDVATLVKQFCRELPEPLFPLELHDALLNAQTLPDPKERMAALQLLSCLLPARNFSCLLYLFDFLHKVAQRCSDNLMTSSNLATVFLPCLLPPPNKVEMSEGRLELRVLVLRTFVEHPHIFGNRIIHLCRISLRDVSPHFVLYKFHLGVIPKHVIDGMDFLMNIHPLKDAFKKKGNGKRHSLKAPMKTSSWSQSKPKVRPAASLQTQSSTSGDGPKLRRSLGLMSFPNIQPFRICMPIADPGFRPAAALAGSKNAHKISVLSAMDRLQFTNWRRRSLP
ncbi:rho GTPase-activating protein 11A-like isoform X1 [Cyprinodon tularosa]|uniref:rho GTPase-activating protein 11A-like isoform X1 n=1 Tax=Cyprinodon tularosa TaxID=77115 RepID=UPI0018E25BAF|nr:rho GTPase-activating protein 11A-like isoform X1 [Cyprinodon tularosa]